MDGAVIVRASGRDASAIRELTRAAYAKWVPIAGREPLPMRVDYDRAVVEHRFDLLHLDGTLSALIETVERPDHLLIENVAVLPKHQGKGLGKRLMVHAETLAADAGLDEVRLYTNKLFAENIRLYLRLGYRVDREEALNGGVAVHMSKRLRPARNATTAST